MKRSWSKYIFYSIIGLGAIGLISMLLNNPTALLKQILIAGIIIGVGILLYRLFILYGNRKQAGYRRALKQSKRLQKERIPRPSHLKVIRSKSAKVRQPFDNLRKRNHHHLTVIDGKKKKKRKKVFF